MGAARSSGHITTRCQNPEDQDMNLQIQSLYMTTFWPSHNGISEFIDECASKREAHSWCPVVKVLVLYFDTNAECGRLCTRNSEWRPKPTPLLRLRNLPLMSLACFSMWNEWILISQRAVFGILTRQKKCLTHCFKLRYSLTTFIIFSLPKKTLSSWRYLGELWKEPT